MNYISSLITFQEIPTEVSLSYLIAGCPLRCKGCHSADSWNPKNGQALSYEQIAKDIERSLKIITCVLFLGGEWAPTELIEILKLIKKNYKLKTALYTGAEGLSYEITQHLDYLKTGPYKKELGGLGNATTNQKLVDLKTGQILNHLFLIQGGFDDQIERNSVK